MQARSRIQLENFECEVTELTLSIDSFIGYKFTTRKNAVITVIGRSEKHERKYVVHCSLCSQDTELFQEPLEMERTHLRSGRVPCGCSLSPKYKEHHYLVLCKREAARHNLVFKGFSEPFHGRTTEVKLYCEKHNNSFTDTIRGLLRRDKKKCSFCHQEHTNRFVDTSFRADKNCYLYVVQLENKSTGLVEMCGLRVTNHLGFYKRSTYSSKYNRQYTTDILFARFHINGEVPLKQIEHLTARLETSLDGDMFLFEPTEENIKTVLDHVRTRQT